MMVFELEKKPERIWPGASGGSQATFLFQPDTILPFQYFERLGRHSLLEGEKRLMLAVLEDAVVVFQKYYFASDEKGKELFREAEEWIIEERDDRLFSFTSICEQLEINSDYLRRGLLQWREKQISLLQLSQGKEVKTMPKDLVCGMEVDEKKAEATSTYQENTYYFCAKGCKVAFDKEPEKYLSGEKSHSD